MVSGVIKFFNAEKHFGFVKGDDGKEYFLHASAVAPGTTLTQGDKVTFKIVQGDRGEKAEDIVKE